MILHLTRDSVAAGDDVDAPHAQQFVVPDQLSLAEVLQWVLARRYLARVAGGRATWSVEAARPLAVVAQQWPQARLLPGLTPTDLARTDNQLTLHFRYHQQLNPETVYAALTW